MFEVRTIVGAKFKEWVGKKIEEREIYIFIQKKYSKCISKVCEHV